MIIENGVRMYLNPEGVTLFDRTLAVLIHNVTPSGLLFMK